MKHNIVFIYCSGIDNVLLGSSKVAGIQVQMSFWARTFVKEGWTVMSFSNQNRLVTQDGIRFIERAKSNRLTKLHLEIIQELSDCIKCIKLKPDLILVRGASRCLFFLSKMCRRKNIRLIHFGASDTDFIPGKEIVGGNTLNRKLYQNALHHIDYFVTQNKEQQTSLWNNYGKTSIIIPNIWIPTKDCASEKLFDAIWVANLRPLKRAEWFVELAKGLPQYHFAIVGGPLIKDYYEYIEQSASEVNNLSLLGAKSFQEVNDLLSQSRVLVCTSEFEGFPNTFLQAWAQGLPVISTVNPSKLLTTNHLGCFVESQEELETETLSMLSDENRYNNFVFSIKHYFLDNHFADKAYEKLSKYIQQ
jgi:glycosyltransferase involved in cell wall biosynthesis